MRRPLVLWIGEAPTDGIANEFRNRALELTSLSSHAEAIAYAETDSGQHLLSVRAAVLQLLSQDPNQPDSQLIKLTRTLLDAGAHVYVLTPDNESSFRETQRHLNQLMSIRSVVQSECPQGIDALGRLEIRGISQMPPIDDAGAESKGNTQPSLAEHIRRRKVLRPVGKDVDIRGDIDKAEDEQSSRALLKRAFSDAATLQLTHLPGGATADAFEVGVTAIETGVASRHIPYFAKIGAIEDIARELQNYELWVTTYVPSHMRPVFDSGRHCFGSTKACLVGSFVGNSESLKDVAARHQSGAVIHELFEDVLVGWRAQGQLRKNISVCGDLVVALSETTREARLETAKVQASIVRSGEQIESPEILLRQLKSYRANAVCGITHGDLHTNNIRVYRGRPIIIDFGSISHGAPLVLDPARLEVSVVFDALGEEEPARGWIRCVEDLYLGRSAGPIPARFGETYGPLWSAVRSIRLAAISSLDDPRNYACALAGQLLWWSARRVCTQAEIYRRPFAYRIANHLIGSLGGESN